MKRSHCAFFDTGVLTGVCTTHVDAIFRRSSSRFFSSLAPVYITVFRHTHTHTINQRQTNKQTNNTNTRAQVSIDLLLFECMYAQAGVMHAGRLSRLGLSLSILPPFFSTAISITFLGFPSRVFFSRLSCCVLNKSFKEEEWRYPAATYEGGSPQTQHQRQREQQRQGKMEQEESGRRRRRTSAQTH